jgi:hypothetical protein
VAQQAILSPYALFLVSPRVRLLASKYIAYMLFGLSKDVCLNIPGVS